VLSSLWEGLPVVFQESMIAGKPIVANNVDGARDVITDGKTGYLVTPRQPQEMADRILTLLNNEELCCQMGVTAKQLAEQYSSDGMIKQIESLYLELLKEYYGGNFSQA
jgi:glycosyltransferase involved in cell wall biosynthesis